jgi:hypothetical protein
LKIFNIEEQLILLEKYKINSDELLFITVILLIQEGEANQYIQTYFSLPNECRGSIRELLLSLQEKQIITKDYKIPPTGSKFIPEDITFNKNFIKNFYKASFYIGKELFEAYPMFCTINGCPTSIRSVSKKFDSLEDFYRFYGKQIGWNPVKHAHIMELVKWGSEHNVINCTLCNFIIDKKYEVLEAMRDGDVNNVNFDAVKLI